MEPIIRKIRPLFFAACLLGVHLTAQNNDNPFELRKGALRSSGAISPGLMKDGDGANIYLHGNFDFFLSDHFSLRGDGFYYITTTGGFNTFKKNHQLFSGFSFHAKPQGFSPYAGMLMGRSFTELNTPGIVFDPDVMGVCPVVSPHVGFNFYGEKYFHIFAEARYVTGRHFPEHLPPFSLNELRFSFGLGWNINTMKKQTL